MRTVHKFDFGESESMEVPWPIGARIALVAQQANVFPTVWIEYDTDRLTVAQRRLLFVIGTGHPVTPPDLEHVGSAVCGPFVWHVYGEHIEDPF